MRNLKKVIALVAVFAMLVTSLSVVGFAQTYGDVTEENTYYEAIEMLSSLSVLTGDDDDGDGVFDFRDTDTITRAEMATIVSRIQGIDSASQTATSFSDVPATHWASGFIAQAEGQGIVNGYGDGTFGPEDPVLFEQVVKMLMVTLGYEPMAQDNGGYPTGYLTAAQRAGVLNGVIGGVGEAKATRGQVAQLVYNALDTPLMDRYTYGTNAEYVIYNGKNGHDYESLLTRDLKVKKFSGIVSENRVTSLEYGKTDIDTEDDEEIVILADMNDSYNNYDIKDLTGVEYSAGADPVATNNVYAGTDFDGEYIGRHVEVYVKEGDSANKYYIISISESTRNKTLEISLDNYDSYDEFKSYIYYYKNPSDRSTVSAKVDYDANVLLNGVALNSMDVEEVFSTIVKKNSGYSGQIVLIDNDTENGYDVVYIESGAPAVVKSVSANGRVSFKNAIKNIQKASLPYVEFDEDIKDQVVKLTADGIPVDVSELGEWDVLSVYYNENANYYDLRVVGSDAIEGSVGSKAKSETSADGYKYTINGQVYEVSQNAYGMVDGGWKPGASGVFYIDDFGKIVAYNKNGSSSVSNGAYAYVLNAVAEQDAWNKSNVRMQILDRSNKVYEGYLAASVELENVEGTGIKDSDGDYIDEDGTYKVVDLDSDSIVNAVVNNLITYSSNSTGEMKTITFAAEPNDDNIFELTKAGIVTDYKDEDFEIKVNGKSFSLDTDTKVFFIKGDKVIVEYADPSEVASKTASKVGTIASIGDVTGKEAYVFDAANDTVGAIVFMNTSGGVTDSNPIALIDSVGTASVSGDTVAAVSFWYAGELITAYTDPDMDAELYNDIKNANQGDVFKFALSADGSTITDGSLYAEFDGLKRSTGFDAGFAGISYLGGEGIGELSTKVTTYFGPAIGYTSAGKIKVADWNPSYGDWDLGNEGTTIKPGEANVYVYDPVKNSNNISIGDAGSVTVDDDIVKAYKDGKTGYVEFRKGNYEAVEVPAELALGVFDYVYAVEYDGDVTDIVIYRARDLKPVFNEMELVK